MCVQKWPILKGDHHGGRILICIKWKINDEHNQSLCYGYEKNDIFVDAELVRWDKHGPIGGIDEGLY